MEYGSVIWDLHTAENIRSIEMVQHKSAMFVYRDYKTTSSVTTMLNNFSWTTLQEHRARLQAKAVMMYRIVNNLVCIPATYLTPAAVNIRGHYQRFLVPHARSSRYKQSSFPDSIRILNQLPHQVIACNSFKSFKSELQTISLR